MASLPIFDLLAEFSDRATDITLSSSGRVAVRQNTAWAVTHLQTLRDGWRETVDPLFPLRPARPRHGYTTVWTAPDGRRYRAAVVPDRRGETVTLRPLPAQVRPIDELRLPNGLRDYVLGLRGGLFLVGGVTGSGKTTTLTALLRELAEYRGGKFITIEDPIEYLHEDTDTAFFDQREISTTAETYADALKDALHQNPDVILVQEIREPAAAETALAAALSGHLVLASIHAYTAPTTPQRYLSILNPAFEDSGARDALAACLEGVVLQRLVAGTEGLVPIFEVMYFRSKGERLTAMERLLRAGNWVGLRQEMETGRRLGMMQWEDSLEQRRAEGLLPLTADA